ncbi:hypothetical protein [uncultured Paenibacillus sp.]|uniref:hypothetical protein n=1 Tax=uncultured Paenibacillus sp. TaxID=227322 RepID=UPI0028D833D7|nr:hypothetical protein [uncultured Paenibacillus sp.]
MLDSLQPKQPEYRFTADSGQFRCTISSLNLPISEKSSFGWIIYNQGLPGCSRNAAAVHEIGEEQRLIIEEINIVNA